MAEKKMVVASDVVGTVEQFYKKLPSLPINTVDILYKIAPWLALIFGILGVLVALGGLGILTVVAPLAVLGGVGNYGLGILSAIGLGISSLLLLLAFSGLKAGKLSGWNLLFWSEAINIVASLLGLAFGSVIGGLIGLYLIFQIKPRYK